MSDRLTVDFDHHDPNFHERRLDEWASLRSCPVAFNPNHGGFWVVSGYDEVQAVARGDGTVFSRRYEHEPVDGVDYVGIMGLPKMAEIHVLGSGLAEVSEELHHPLRRALTPFVSVAATQALQPDAERYATWFLDEMIESGRGDLVKDLTAPVAGLITMDLVGLPRADWRYYVDVFTIAHESAHDFDKPEVVERFFAAFTAMGQLLTEQLEDRRQNPRDDLLTTLVEFEREDGQRLDDMDLLGQLWFLIGGGLDTTSSTTALALEHLARHPELRQRLLDDPDLVPTAAEEYLRYFAVNETNSRTVREDTVLGGQQLRRGDHLLVSWFSANRDDTVFPDADQVRFDRKPNPHLTFGTGPGKCLGMHIARMELDVMLRAVLDRIPDFEVGDGGVRLAPPNPILTVALSLPVRFTPGSRSGPTERPF
ncbi:MAG TPA: cytochrome P450 [Acidimicrobiales bacterium]|nr:cytochrome P450 [Acidimicrobiales bacterium]